MIVIAPRSLCRQLTMAALLVAALNGCSTSRSTSTPEPVGQTAPIVNTIKAAQVSEPTTTVDRFLAQQGAFAEDVNPITDSSGVHCGSGQPKDVWFVAGSFGNEVGDVTKRSCNIPAGKILVGPVLNFMYDPNSPITAILTAESKVELDGVMVPFRQETADAFQVDFAVGNPVSSGFSGKVGGHGYWFETPPLKPGRHTLSILGVDQSGFRVHVVYDITAAA
jgi:hypothetical protein